MATLSGKSTILKSGGAVPVSRNLQIFVISAAALSLVLPIASLIPMYVSNIAGYRGDYAAWSVVNAVYPVLIFGAACYYSPIYPALLQRVFIATIKTLSIMAVVWFLSSIKSYWAIFFSRHYAGDTLPPAWMSSFALDYIIITAAVIGTILYSYLRYRVRH